MVTKILNRHTFSDFIFSFVITVIIGLLFACEKLEINREIKIETDTVVIINIDASAEIKGYLLDLGEVEIISHGHCWSTLENPTIMTADTTNCGKANSRGPFVSHLTGFQPETKYYIGAYATTSQGTLYGNVIQFNTLPVFDDNLKVNLISFWSLDESTGSTVNDLFAENDLTVQAGVDMNQTGLIGKSALFYNGNGGLRYI